MQKDKEAFNKKPHCSLKQTQVFLKLQSEPIDQRGKVLINLMKLHQFQNYVLKKKPQSTLEIKKWTHIIFYKVLYGAQHQIYQIETKCLKTFFATLTFTNLTKLTIEECRLDNIQFVSLIDAPNLETLELSQNYIRTLKPISKIREMKKLKNFEGSSLNMIHNIKPFQRFLGQFSLNSPVYIQFEQNFKNQAEILQVSSLCEFAKLNVKISGLTPLLSYDDFISLDTVSPRLIKAIKQKHIFE